MEKKRAITKLRASGRASTRRVWWRSGTGSSSPRFPDGRLDDPGSGDGQRHHASKTHPIRNGAIAATARSPRNGMRLLRIEPAHVEGAVEEFRAE